MYIAKSLQIWKLDKSANKICVVDANYTRKQDTYRLTFTTIISGDVT